MTVKWKKQASQTSGYEIVYTADASFGKKKYEDGCDQKVIRRQLKKSKD